MFAAVQEIALLQIIFSTIPSVKQLGVLVVPQERSPGIYLDVGNCTAQQCIYYGDDLENKWVELFQINS